MVQFVPNKVFSRPGPLSRQLSSRQLPSTPRLLYRLGTYDFSAFVSVHLLRRMENGVLDIFTQQISPPATLTIPLLPYEFERQ